MTGNQEGNVGDVAEEHTPGKFFAHSANASGRGHDLGDHLVSVADRAGEFAESFGAGLWGYLAGLWHDLGKSSRKFQEYLAAATQGGQTEQMRGSVDHASAGAQHAVATVEIMGHLLAYPIAGHHAGLLDAVGDHACLEKRLSKGVPNWGHFLQHLPTVPPPELPDFLKQALSDEDPGGTAFKFSFFTRMLFSCLADADFLDTEKFLDPEAAGARPSWPDDILDRLSRCLDSYVAERFGTSDAPIARTRAEVRKECLEAAAGPPGLFSLTVPTGGGKTLASLAFALRHARLHGLHRIVYVVPFTSIIEQNAQVFREVAGPLVEQGFPDPVTEHHSTVDPQKTTTANRLAAENWDAPVVVTTSVQFYESLFSNRTSRCRKLHNLACSVLILDEAQKLPVDYLSPCLMALRELAANYGSTIVLCTATQPAVHRRDDFPIGLEGVREIISEPPRLYAALKRVSVKNLGPVSDDELVERLAEHAQVMCIVNTRRHARDLFGKCRDLEGTHHLSAAMCPAHRTERLTAIQDALHRGDPCHVVATQVVEAGVDLDFPVVYRSQAGLDSVAQAAGRCNRNGKAPQGTTFMFRSEHQESEVFIRDTANVARQLVGVEGAKPLYEDFLSLEAVEHYFRLYYWSQKDRWDKNQILDKLKLQKSKILPFLFDFETIARNFHLIEEAGEPVFVPWGPEGGHLCRQLCSMGDVVPVSLLRALQRYVVQVPPRIWDNSLTGPLSLVKGAYAVLPCLDPYYRQDVGLCLDVDQFDAEALMV